MDTLIAKNLALIQNNIEATCTLAGRSAKDVKLIAVSKKKNQEHIQTAYNAKQFVFGENYIQEALEKVKQLQNLSKIEWHFIGSLQSNKAKFIPGTFSMLHSLESISLAKILNKESEKKLITQSVLVQINIDSEKSKSGILTDNLEDFLNTLNSLDRIKVEGLMAIPNPQEPSRKKFAQLRILMDQANQKNWYKSTLHHLSMGMTNDYEDAIKEGATLLRIGTAIFGERS